MRMVGWVERSEPTEEVSCPGFRVGLARALDHLRDPPGNQALLADAARFSMRTRSRPGNICIEPRTLSSALLKNFAVGCTTSGASNCFTRGSA